MEAVVRATDGRWVQVFFLIDLGSDGTYVPSEYMADLGLQLDKAKIEDDVTGVGGQRVEHLPFTTQLRFINDNGDEKSFDWRLGSSREKNR